MPRSHASLGINNINVHTPTNVMPPILIRDAPAPPAGLPAPEVRSRLHASQQILFRHPQYDDSSNILFKLFAPDNQAGLFARFALDACGIIVGNRWDGWLTEQKAEGAAKVDPNSILDKPKYYFHLPHKNSTPYPIIPNFREWEFPHDNLPTWWSDIQSPLPPKQTFSASGLSVALLKRDSSCRISGWTEGTQVAHICPQSEEDWFTWNSMSRYNVGNSNTVNDLANTCLLRADLHIAFDKPKFVFVPKPTPDSNCIVTHLVEASAELESLYHNHRLQPVQHSIELMFARFAWTIFPWLDAFLTGGKSRTLIGRSIVASGHIEHATPTFFSPQECAQHGVKASRSRSPKKRGRQAEEVERQAEEVERPDGEVIRDERNKRRRLYHGHDHKPSGTKVRSQLNNQSSPLASASSLVTEDGGLAPDTPGPDELRHTWLQQERHRSDPHRTWEEEKEWAQEVYNGKITLNEADARRWLEINGGEFLDDNDS